MNRLKNKKVLITGANSGIGKACAEMLKDYGVELILTVRDKNKIEDFKDATIIELDVRNSSDVEKALEGVNPDILINNAGFDLGLESLEEGSIDDWDTMIDTNIKGLLYVTKAAVDSLTQSMNIDALGTNIRISNVAPGAVETNFSNTRFHGDDEKADAVYEGFKPLSAEDIAEIVLFILNAPEHVNIQDMLVMPTAQRNPYLLHRNI